MVGFPALAAGEVPWVRIVSCNPAEIKDERVPPVFSGYPSHGPQRLVRVLARVPAPDRPARGRARRVRAHARRTTAPRPRADRGLALAQRLSVPGGARLRPRLAAAGRLAEARVLRARRKATLVAAAGRGPTRISEPRLARVRRRRAHAGPDRRAGASRRCPGRGLARAPARLAAPAQPHERRRIPAPDRDPPPGRCGHHPRRQQHGHRERSLRRADGGAAPVLGSARQRPAGAGVRARPAARHLRPRAGRAPRRRPPAARRGRPSRPARAGRRPAPARPGTVLAARAIERVANSS